MKPAMNPTGEPKHELARSIAVVVGFLYARVGIALGDRRGEFFDRSARAADGNGLGDGWWFGAVVDADRGAELVALLACLPCPAGACWERGD